MEAALVTLAGSPSDAPRRSSRIAFIDVSRSVAIIGAMCAHALAAFNVWPQVPVGALKAVGNAIFYSCSPTFFLLFGALLELVYVQRLQRTGSASVTQSLLGRAGLCWLCLTLGTICAWMSGRLGSSEVGPAFLSLIDTPYSGILRFYALALLLSLPVVLLRPRFGVALPIGIICGLWIGTFLMSYLPWPTEQSRWAFLCGFLFAHPPVWSGGSLWNNLSIVFLGMVLGYYMRRRQREGLRPLGGRPLLWVVALCIGGSLVCMYDIGAFAFIKGYLSTGRQFRSACYPGYFFISTLSALGVIGAAQVLFPVGTRLDEKLQPLLGVGRHSLLIFTAGNAGLNLLPANCTLSWENGLILTVGFLCALVALGYFADRFPLDVKQRQST
jgi:hypothetical protein